MVHSEYKLSDDSCSLESLHAVAVNDKHNSTTNEQTTIDNTTIRGVLSTNNRQYASHQA